MARGRFISKEIAEDLEFHELSNDTCRLAYILLITFADVEGRITGDLDYLASKLFPRRREIGSDRLKEYIVEWADAGFIVWYEQSNGHLAIQLVNFDKHQKGLRKDREAASYYENPENCRILAGSYPDNQDKDESDKPVKELKDKDSKEESLSIKVKGNSTKNSALIPAEIPQKSGVNFNKIEELEGLFEELTGLIKPSENLEPRAAMKWENALTVWGQIGATREDVEAAIKESDESGLTMSSPASITSFIKSAIARRDRGMKGKHRETVEEMEARLLGHDVVEGK